MFMSSGKKGRPFHHATTPKMPRAPRRPVDFIRGHIAPNPEVYEPRGTMLITQEWDAVVYHFVVRGVFPLSTLSLRCDPEGNVLVRSVAAGVER